MYGISNCDTVKKARKWFDANGIEYTFCDFRKNPVDADIVRSWIQSVGRQVLINKRGTTYRQLDQAQKTALDASDDEALIILLQNPTLMKRPIIVSQLGVGVGFKDNQYADLIRRAS
tara:strand:+ start:351 stop:701 length:351 start_codon:yes stop_codon:yes gene_type:complete